MRCKYHMETNEAFQTSEAVSALCFVQVHRLTLDR